MKLPIYFCNITFIAKTKKTEIVKEFQSSVVFNNNQVHNKQEYINHYCHKFLVTQSKGISEILKLYDISVTFNKIYKQGFTTWEAQEENEEQNKDS